MLCTYYMQQHVIIFYYLTRVCVYNILILLQLVLSQIKKHVKQYNHLVTRPVHPARHVCVVMQFEKILIDAEVYRNILKILQKCNVKKVYSSVYFYATKLIYYKINYNLNMTFDPNVIITFSITKLIQHVQVQQWYNNTCSNSIK